MLLDEDGMSTTKGGSESSASEIRSASEEPMEHASFTFNLWQQNRPIAEGDNKSGEQKVVSQSFYYCTLSQISILSKVASDLNE